MRAQERNRMKRSGDRKGQRGDRTRNQSCCSHAGAPSGFPGRPKPTEVTLEFMTPLGPNNFMAIE
jgi:hypothetical protein